MNEQPSNLGRKTNRLALISLILGITSFLPYLLASITNINHWPDEALQSLFFVGVVFGASSFVIGKKALEKIKKSDNKENGQGLISTGRLFSILGIIGNIVFAYFLAFSN